MGGMMGDALPMTSTMPVNMIANALGLLPNG